MSSRYILIIAIFAKTTSSDNYVDELKGRCNETSKSFSCSKHKLFDFLDRYGFAPDNAPRTLGGFVRFVKMAENRTETRMFRESRYAAKDSETMKIIKFVQRKADQFLGSQGLAVLLPEGAEILDVDSDGLGDDESRGRKKGGGKRKEMLIPLIMLFKLFKIKVLVSLVLLAVLFIKKTILVTAMFLPSVIQSIKNHCKLSYHVVPHHVEEEHHEHDVTGTGWGYTGYDANLHDWDKNRIQRISLYRPHRYVKL